MDISLPLLKLGGLKNAEYLCGLNSPYSQNRTRDAAIQALEIQFLGILMMKFNFWKESRLQAEYKESLGRAVHCQPDLWQ